MGVPPGTSPEASADEGFGLALRDLSVAYGARTILRDLSLDVPAGSTTCLLGPSGIGKSTLLRRVAGLIDGPGTVQATDGQPLAGRVALMGQGDGLLPWLNALDNVLLGSRLRGERADRDRGLAMLARVGLAEAAESRPATLSGGMRQRVALARTLMEDCPLVLMDEPFSAVDALTRLRLQDLAAEMLAGRTVLMVTHDPWEAIRISHAITVMTGDPATISRTLEPGGQTPRAIDTDSARDHWRQLMEALGEMA
ncbi:MULTISPECIES: ABC transporter ATP-binding protein [unclassified Minwuia]|jgi:putative hydroxymethylpyrimidine transport system ATP-binding protein|uniref:ABC transporter ATP-binding protein n=1 Tax=unclassified Minwuia TaxID=2618799 RepID=UPI0024793FC6|nr:MULTISPECIES: ABC transporter ATP-binding protein [unclassified Minwuia]